MNNNKFFETSDLALAAALYTVCELDGLEKSDARRVIFRFKSKAGIEKLVEDFWNKRFMVDALSYFGAIKNLKSRIYEQ